MKRPFTKEQKKIGKIHVDFISKKMPFEGRKDDYLKSQKHISSTGNFLLRGRVRVKIPAITDVWTYKLKAAWDRNYRLERGISTDIEWKEGKLSKDYSDIVSLVDADEPLDPTVMKKRFSEFPFLKSVIDLLNENPELYTQYIRISHPDEAEIKRKISRIADIF